MDERSTSSPEKKCRELSRLIGRKVLLLENVGGGRNSQVYRAVCEKGSQFAVKYYFRHKDDKRDRIGTEFYSSQFLWKNGVKNIPCPIIMDRQLGCSVYEYADGGRITSKEVDKDDIDVMVDFIRTLKELTRLKESRSLPKASEACLSIKDLFVNIGFRTARLTSLNMPGTQYEMLKNFMEREFLPFLDEIRRYCKDLCKELHVEYDKEISLADQILSPSDFGFHNTIRLRDGRIIFIDFEYFGWDDPAKTISDFILHPGMTIGKDLRRRFSLGVLNKLDKGKNLVRRTKILCPLFGMKWSLILLNEFIPSDLKRRQFASSGQGIADSQIKQFIKASQMLNFIKNNYKQMDAYFSG